jgi:hypothetical protein
VEQNEIQTRQLFVRTENTDRNLGPQINQEKTKYTIVEMKNSLKQNKIGHLNIKNYKFERLLHTLHWFGQVQRMEENRILKTFFT